MIAQARVARSGAGQSSSTFTHVRGVCCARAPVQFCARGRALPYLRAPRAPLRAPRLTPRGDEY